VIRLSKKYLPGMAISYQHPKVKTHIGDGFKFLDDYKNEFDVIITDSSDPEGPAESLFQKPYFELLFGALKEGGVITTQGCTFSFVKLDLDIFTFVFSNFVGDYLVVFVFPRRVGTMCSASALHLCEHASFFTSYFQGSANFDPAENQWLHLPLITKLKKDCKEVFPNVEYAYTTIPTYPSGQIGFMVCCKDANRDLKTPLRSWTPEEEDKLCRYYNADIHKASFVLPTFARTALR
jgi:spermidine synthase